jgi:hypothetical protein
VIHDGAIVLVALEIPALVRLMPLAVAVGLPVVIAIGRHPDPAEIFGPDPGTLLV